MRFRYINEQAQIVCAVPADHPLVNLSQSLLYHYIALRQTKRGSSLESLVGLRSLFSQLCCIHFLVSCMPT